MKQILIKNKRSLLYIYRIWFNKKNLENIISKKNKKIFLIDSKVFLYLKN